MNLYNLFPKYNTRSPSLLRLNCVTTLTANQSNKLLPQLTHTCIFHLTLTRATTLQYRYTMPLINTLHYMSYTHSCTGSPASSAKHTCCISNSHPHIISLGTLCSTPTCSTTCTHIQYNWVPNILCLL